MRPVSLALCTLLGCAVADPDPVPPGPPGDADTDTDADSDTDTDADTDPLDLPLWSIDDLDYAGAFRVSADPFGASELNYSVGPIAYDAVNDSVFLVGHAWDQAVAEFPSPGLVDSEVLSELRMSAAPRQVFASVLDRAASNPDGLDTVGGLLVVDGELLVHAYEYYDAPGDNSTSTLVVRDAADLAGARVDGMFSLTGTARSAGWMSPVPAAWVDVLGATHLSGNSSGEPIISRLSVGPSAFAFDPWDIVGFDGAPGPVSATELLGYSLDHPLHDDLSNDARTNDLWTHLSRARYGFVVPGTRTYAALGHSGGHATGVCYKCVPVGATEACGGYCANDASDVGAYYWLFDLADLLAVRDGAQQPWEVAPYAHGPMTLPFGWMPGGGSFDPASELLYLTIQRGDTEQGPFANPPVIAAFRLR